MERKTRSFYSSSYKIYLLQWHPVKVHRPLALRQTQEKGFGEKYSKSPQTRRRNTSRPLNRQHTAATIPKKKKENNKQTRGWLVLQARLVSGPDLWFFSLKVDLRGFVFRAKIIFIACLRWTLFCIVRDELC